MNLTKENVCVFIESEAHLEEVNRLLSKEKKSKELISMFEHVDRFVNFISRSNNKICIYFDSNGFNGWTKEDPYYLPNKKQITLTELEQILIEEKGTI